ncbi:MAG: type II toxin-antitoxin system PemK/MazF family toxin [Xanthobacteraceae bacterium]
MICDFGDVVVVPFPFVDLAAEKRRPSLILSHTTFNESHRHSICAMITTAARSKWPSDVAIEDLKPAGLDRPCVVRWKLFTLPNDFILRRAGRLAARDRDNVVSVARNILA